MTTPAVIPRRDVAAIRRRAVRKAYARSPAPDRPERPTRVHLWLPVTPVFALLAPFVLLLAPLGYLCPPRYRPDPFAAALALGAVLLSLGGTRIVVQAQDADIAIRLF